MKKFFSAITLVVLLGALLVACTPNSLDNTGDINLEPTQTQNVNMLRRPSWAEGLSDDEEHIFFIESMWQGFDSIDELAEWAGRYIVRVEVLDERTELINLSLGDLPNYDISTINRLKVLEVFQGNTQAGEIIEVAQAGGQYENLVLTSNDLIALSVGEELIVFLGGVCPEEYSEFPDARFAFLMNPWQGIYHVPEMRGADEMGAMSQDDSTPLESYHPDNELVLTIGDLARIAQAGQQATS